ncbi:hypothetical protein MMC21_002941 [Puttea exsequens]|nr:hypothetical protein [Puttea exsequens]
MPLWRDEYMSALQERDKREKTDQATYEKYTKLADRTAALRTPADRSLDDERSASPKMQDPRETRDRSVTLSDPSDKIARMRQDLSEAQRSRGLIETRLHSVTEELSKLKIQASLDNKRIAELTKEKTVLSTKLKDRDEELKGKTKLLEDVHDETVSLTLELNMAEERSQKLRSENKELVDRWMARMGQEADAMNVQSKFS